MQTYLLIFLVADLLVKPVKTGVGSIFNHLTNLYKLENILDDILSVPEADICNPCLVVGEDTVMNLVESNLLLLLVLALQGHAQDQEGEEEAHLFIRKPGVKSTCPGAALDTLLDSEVTLKLHGSSKLLGCSRGLHPLQ